MFSALKFVAAGVIVALFGGFLLTGILTTPQGDDALPAAVTESPFPMMTEELLSGMVTEEVAPGVFRVVNDGVRDLRSANNVGIVAGHDGGVWLYRKNRLIRLGDVQGHEWPADPYKSPGCINCGGNPFAVDQRGTVWAGLEGRVLRSFDGTGWTTHEPLPAQMTLDEIQIGPEGPVVVNRRREGIINAVFIGSPTTEGWSQVEVPEGTQDLVVTTSGNLLAAELVTGSSAPGIVVRRWADGTWQDWRFGPTEALSSGYVYLGRDGTAWASAKYEGSDERHLIRLDGNGTQAWAPDRDHHHWAMTAVGPDGSVWGELGPCEGPGDRFDGEAWTCHLNDLMPHVSVSGFAADGSLWVLAEGAGRPYEDVYVITPEAMSASE